MIEKNNSKMMLYISIATLILSLLGFIFGENILDKFSGPELNMSSTKIRMNLPDKFISTYTNKNDDVSSMPEYYRLVEITNEGSAPSKNLRLIVNTDGDIYDYKIDSAEKVNELKVSNEKITAEFKRLSPNAKVILELWLNDGDKTFQVNYADDNNSGLLEKKQGESNNKFFEYVMLIISILSTGIFVYSKYYLSSKQKLKEVNFENQELGNRVDTMIERLEDETNNNQKEETNNNQEEKILYERLEEFINNQSKFK